MPYRIAGAKIDTYLLEKVRLVTQNKGERNYHVFYQMLAGGADADISRWAVDRDPNAYHFLAQSGCVKLREIDDVSSGGGGPPSPVRTGMTSLQHIVVNDGGGTSTRSLPCTTAIDIAPY